MWLYLYSHVYLEVLANWYNHKIRHTKALLEISLGELTYW